MKYSTDAYAKINLYLDVKEKRPDGYHEIESIMQQVSLCDTITLEKNEFRGENRIKVTCGDPSVPTDGKNIVWKCAEKFFTYFGIAEYDITIDIVKRIPSSAGLAGGSSDGAAVLKLLNEAFGVGAADEELCSIGAKVGADIPFCIVGGACVCRGIGEILTPLALPEQKYHVIVAYPNGGGVSTPEAYALLDNTPRDGDFHSIVPILAQIRNGEAPRSLYNAFERAVLPVHDGARTLREKIAALGADTVMMSGSGPSVFAIFADEEAMRRALVTLENDSCRFFACKPVN